MPDHALYTADPEYLRKVIQPHLKHIFKPIDGGSDGVPDRLTNTVRDLHICEPTNATMLAVSVKRNDILEIPWDEIVRDVEFRWHLLLVHKMAFGQNGTLYSVRRMTAKNEGGDEASDGARRGLFNIPSELSKRDEENAISTLVGLGVNMLAVAAFLDPAKHAHEVGGCPLNELRLQWMREQRGRTPGWADLLIQPVNGPTLRADGTLCARISGQWHVFHAHAKAYETLGDKGDPVVRYTHFWLACKYLHERHKMRMHVAYHKVPKDLRNMRADIAQAIVHDRGYLIPA